MIANFQIESLESVIAPGKGSTAYKVGHAIGRAAAIAWDVIEFWD